MINYVQLYSWRNLCEFLNNKPYKFAYPYEIQSKCKKCLPSLYGVSRVHRQYLYENYLIQFIHWCPEPDYSYRSRRKRREDYGWQLVREWEVKIDYLEKLVLFGIEPQTKTWEPALRTRIQQRKERKERLELQCKMNYMKYEEKVNLAKSLNICFRCCHPIAFLMIDCTNCGMKQP